MRYIPSQINDEHHIANLANDLDFNVELHNSDLLSKLFFKDIKMSDHTMIEGNYNAKNHILFALAIEIKGNKT